LLREDIRAQRRQITASNMTLTPGEATKSWPIYDQYLQETIKINDDRWAMIKDYAANYNSMTDENARIVDVPQAVKVQHRLRGKFHLIVRLAR
jgi:hypothetical protein